MKNKLKTNIIDLLGKLDGSTLINIMVKSLKKPKTVIQMATYGYQSKGICYECAATNTLLNLYKIKNPLKHLPIYEYYEPFSKKLSKNNEKNFILQCLEKAINDLRQGNIYGYNVKALVSVWASRHKSSN